MEDLKVLDVIKLSDLEALITQLRFKDDDESDVEAKWSQLKKQCSKALRMAENTLSDLDTYIQDISSENGKGIIFGNKSSNTPIKPLREALNTVDNVLEQLSAGIQETKSDQIKEGLTKILESIFVGNQEISQCALIRTRLFDVQGALRNVDYYPKEKDFEWEDRLSTNDVNSPASFFYPPMVPKPKEDTLIPITLIVWGGTDFFSKGSARIAGGEFDLKSEHISVVKQQTIKGFKNGSEKDTDNIDDFEDQINAFFKYLGKYFPGREMPSREEVYDAFHQSTIPKIRELTNSTKRLFAYFIPVLFAGKLIAHLTITSDKIIDKERFNRLEKVYKQLGFLAHLLSASIANVSLQASELLSYFDTQSRLLWFADNDPKDERVNGKKFFFDEPSILNDKQKGDLRSGYDALVRNPVLPIGDRQISEEIMNKIIRPLLEDFSQDFGRFQKKIVGNLDNILVVALDNQDNLKNIPQYRQHFIHSFHVFLTGLRLLSCRNDALKKCCELVEFPENASSKMLKISEDGFVKAWFFASTFHDISYAIANVENWVNKAVAKTVFLGKDTEKHQEIWVRHQIANIFRFQDYHESLHELINFIKSFSQSAKRPSGNDGKDMFQELYEVALGPYSGKRVADHGILSSVMLLNATKSIWGSPWLMLAADAIACHSSLWNSCEDNEKGQDKICIQNKYLQSNKNIMRNLLLISDTIQQWGRSESDKAQRVFTIVLNEWNEKGNSIEIEMRYKLNKKTRKYLIEDKKKQTVKSIKRITDEEKRTKFENILAFFSVWAEIRKQVKKVTKHVYSPCIEINLKLCVQDEDARLIGRRFEDAYEFIARDKDRNYFFDPCIEHLNEPIVYTWKEDKRTH
jgi:hypothetical protein